MKKKALLLALTLALCMPAAAEQGDATITDRLEALGYLYEGQQSLVTALRNFQTANGIFSTGTLDETTLEALNSADAISQAQYLQEFAQKYSDIAASFLDNRSSITALQTSLRNLGYPLGNADGVYGDATRSAVSQFQLANGLYATGEVDASTLIRLYEGSPISWDTFLAQHCAVRGDTGTHVKRLQERLVRYGYFQGEATGSFGELTQQAVTQFQAANSLSETGEADMQTCRLLFSETAQARFVEGEMHMGDESESVSALQRRLAELGYYTGSIEGSFDEATRNALILFQLASGLEITEYADLGTLQAIERNNAPSLESAEELFAATRAEITRQQIDTVLSLASSMQGKTFSILGDGLFPGFGFLQYIFARAGVAITDPGAMVQDPSLPACAPEDIPRGAIVIMQISDEDSVIYAMGVGLGESRMICADPESGWIVSGSIDQSLYSGLYALVLYNGE